MGRSPRGEVRLGCTRSEIAAANLCAENSCAIRGYKITFTVYELSALPSMARHD